MALPGERAGAWSVYTTAEGFPFPVTQACSSPAVARTNAPLTRRRAKFLG